ncbi:MAG: flagellar biosynthesis protein FlhF [Macromonas sp.]
MNVQRFLAPTSREAMNKVKASLGDAAVILSTRTTEDGFEVLAMTEDGLRALPGMTDSTPPPARTVAAQPAAPSRLQQRAADQLPAQMAFSASSSVAQDTETLAMSTLSFQDYVRERMLAKRRDMLQGEAADQAPRATVQRAAAPQPSAPMAAAPYHAPAFDTLPERTNSVGRSAAAVPAMPMGSDDIVLPFGPGAEMGGRSSGAPVAPRTTKAQPQPASATPAAAMTANEARLASELSGLKSLIEERFNTMSWLGDARQNPLQANLMLKFLRAGYSPTVARAVMERMPTDRTPAETFRWVQEVLARNLKTPSDNTALCDEGGVFALIGATGVGKTTTAAKLAAQCVKAYGANSVGLITLDSYRVAGYEQLRAYGRMLGVVSHLAHDRAALQDLLSLLANKRMVIIDTAGLGQRDPRIQDMLEVLETPKIRKMLVLNAGSHGDTLDDVLTAYKDTQLYGVILSKLDEAAKLGPALDALIRHQTVLRGVTTGQRVPEDWQRADATALVRMSMGNSGKSAHDPHNAELGYFFAQPTHAPVKLDNWHV